jgi:FKBP-type peptidyl-prolyl cis-trans isomerase 2
VVTELSGPVASVDFNHPLAGKHLIIDVKILNVESPSGQEGMQWVLRRNTRRFPSDHRRKSHAA